ncbi:MAG: endonuclease domain-containing protein [Candidatus Eisenbacteria bacterium]|nr:endonuclease domain-containing protein [Candidatus Eisenbacteria bacterium]
MDGKRAFRRTLRKHQTDAEGLLWKRLRDRRLLGYKFRRQRSIGPYVVDFVCLEIKVVVELDGGQHGESATEKYDRRRDKYLESEGFRVLRFWNHQVMMETEAVLHSILRVLEEEGEPSP